VIRRNREEVIPMKVLSLALALVLAVAVVGCSREHTNAFAPAPAAAAVANVEQSNVTWTWLDATHLQKTYTLSRLIHGQRVDIGPITVVYVCDYPIGYYGPPSPGHCYTDGSGCVD
jgi:hypothetical protein